MLPLPLPAFGELNYYIERTNTTSSVFTAESVPLSLFEKYTDLLLSHGFEKKEAWVKGENHYAAFAMDSLGIFLHYFGALGELTLVWEEDCRYFAYRDADLPKNLRPQITQMHLEDFGLSYVIRLGDGRFVILDGGCGFPPDTDLSLTHLREHCAGARPVVAAWILSHPHSDHYLAFNFFMERFGEEIVLEKLMLHFPEHDDTEHYPKLTQTDRRLPYSTAADVNIPVMYEHVRKCGAQIHMLHTGQTYRVGDAVFEVLACMENTVHHSQNINATSLVLRMTLGGQAILWCTDASMSISRLPERYGEALKADILQIPHHGFQCGTAEAEIAAYDMIRPEICLLPVSEYNAFTHFCTFREGTRHAMRRLGVSELITGDETRTLVLPYHAPAYAKDALAERFRRGLADNGARTWIFSGLSTAEPQDFVFTLLNTTNFDASVWIELYFERRAQTVQGIRAVVPSMSVKPLCITGDEVDRDAVYFNWLSLAKNGIPENVPFAVRFRSDRPIVITHKTHRAAYHTED